MLKLSTGVLIVALAFTMSRCNTTAPSATTATRAADANSEMADPNAALLVRMLQDPTLWGRDFGAVLRALPAFAAAGEDVVAAKRMQVIGRKRYKDRQSAAGAAARARESGEAPPFRVQLPFTDARRLPPIDAVPFLDDGSVRVGTPETRDLELLKRGVRIDVFIERYGKPDRIEQQLLDDGTERRPIGLTIYWFAGGAIALVTADINDDPRAIDRVFLDTRAVMRAIY